jgi:hypothetical protein
MAAIGRDGAAPWRAVAAMGGTVAGACVAALRR